MNFDSSNLSLYLMTFQPLIAYHYAPGCPNTIPSHLSILARALQDTSIRCVIPTPSHAPMTRNDLYGAVTTPLRTPNSSSVSFYPRNLKRSTSLRNSNHLYPSTRTPTNLVLLSNPRATSPCCGILGRMGDRRKIWTSATACGDGSASITLRLVPANH